MNLETKITIYKFTPQLFTLTQNEGEYAGYLRYYGYRLQLSSDNGG